MGLVILLNWLLEDVFQISRSEIYLSSDSAQIRKVYTEYTNMEQ